MTQANNKKVRNSNVFQRRGLQAELIVANHLISEGYWIFTSLGQNAPCDLVAIKAIPFEITLYDVKVLTIRKTALKNRKTLSPINRVRTATQKCLNVRLVTVDLDTEEITFTNHF